MSVKKLNTLVNLLSDPDVVVYREIFAQLLEQGREAIPILEKEWSENSDAQVRERIENIIQQIHSNEVRQGLQEWLSQPEDEKILIEGAYWIARQSYPNLDFPELLNTVNTISTEIWIALADEELPPLNKLNIFNKIFYHSFSFTSTTDLANPTYCFINRVLESKCGNGVSLGLLYLHIAQQVGLAIEGICTPGAALLSYFDSNGETLCYINPYNKGACLHKNLLTNYFKQHGITLREEYFSICSKTLMVLRLLDYTIHTFEQENNHTQAEAFRLLRSCFGNTESFLLIDKDEDQV